MQIRHEIINVNNNINNYIFIEMDIDTEFSNEFFKNDSDNSFISKFKKYVNKHFKKEDYAILVINGVLIGTVGLSMFFLNEDNLDKNYNNASINIYETNKETEVDNNVKLAEERLKLENKENDVKEIKKEENIVKPVEKISKPIVNPKPVTPKPVSPKPIVKPKPVIPEVKPIPKPEVKPSGIIINLKTNGSVIKINLEDYVVGVVAAEMPASFNSEALKAQAIAARTFAMNKHSKGIILVDSTSHQVYKNVNEMKSMWGRSFNTYYNKVKNAVYNTKGIVLKYNGEYIEALYHSISNGKTELPKYIWGSNYSYLQSVSSNYDKNVRGYYGEKFVSYNDLSKKLGVSVNNNSNITILSKTVSNRVENISFSGKTFSGVKIRSLFGLKSTDFTIIKESKGVRFKTKGFGHGVGMSQYGANEYAKFGYSYRDILNHYYKGVSFVKV